MCAIEAGLGGSQCDFNVPELQQLVKDRDAEMVFNYALSHCEAPSVLRASQRGRPLRQTPTWRTTGVARQAVPTPDLGWGFCNAESASWTASTLIQAVHMPNASTLPDRTPSFISPQVRGPKCARYFSEEQGEKAGPKVVVLRNGFNSWAESGRPVCTCSGAECKCEA